MTEFPPSTRWLQFKDGAIALKSDGSVWRVVAGRQEQLCSENEWLSAPVGEPEGEWHESGQS